MTTDPTSQPSADIPSVLQRIVHTKHSEIAAARAELPLAALQSQVAADTRPRRGFATALRDAQQSNRLGIIAEIKKASPSKGIINHNFDPTVFASQYEKAGASCLSVLTDRDYFQGDDAFLVAARAACTLPVLRKDFMIDEYQIYQSYLLGADCILLIMACLDDQTVQELHALSIRLGMDILIEIHTQDELTRALRLPYSAHNIYGINNRDLNTFTVDLQHSIMLKNALTAGLKDKTSDTPLIVTESGIDNVSDVTLMQNHGFHHFLIGEHFMKTEHPGNALQSLLASIPLPA